MKLLLSLLLMSFASIASNEVLVELNCPKFDRQVALSLEPEKQYFRDTVRTRVESEETSDSEIYNFLKQFDAQQRRIKLTNNVSLATEIGAPIVYSMKYYREQYFGRENHLTTQHVPAAVTYKTPFGYLAGDSRGEFGGELVFVSNTGIVEFIQEMNVEDIYKFEFGYVVTEGLNHMSINRGMLHIVTFSNNKPQISKLFGLTGAPKSSLKLPNGDLLINSRDDSQLLKTDGSLVRVLCTSNQQTHEDTDPL